MLPFALVSSFVPECLLFGLDFHITTRVNAFRPKTPISPSWGLGASDFRSTVVYPCVSAASISRRVLGVYS